VNTLFTKIIYPFSDISFLKGLSPLTCNAGSYVASIFPQQSAFRQDTTFSQNISQSHSLKYINLVFNENYDIQNSNNALIIDNQKFAYFGFQQIKSPEAFANFAFEKGIEDFKSPDNFWVPFETALTRRQLEILFHVYRGDSSKQIAETLSLSRRTVELHRQNCINKIGALSPKKLERIFSFTLIETLSAVSNL
jgi:DNA-binding NarL/FixJ family response regulator